MQFLVFLGDPLLVFLLFSAMAHVERVFGAINS